MTPCSSLPSVLGFSHSSTYPRSSLYGCNKVDAGSYSVRYCPLLSRLGVMNVSEYLNMYTNRPPSLTPSPASAIGLYHPSESSSLPHGWVLHVLIAPRTNSSATRSLECVVPQNIRKNFVGKGSTTDSLSPRYPRVKPHTVYSIWRYSTNAVFLRLD